MNNENKVDERILEPQAHVNNVPDYPLCPRMKEQLISLGYSPELAKTGKHAFDFGHGYWCTWEAWREGMYMMPWDVNSRCWSIRNFAVCKN